MAIKRLDHINFITNNMPATIDFYTRIIGLVHGAKLSSAANGMEYLYLPGQNIAVLHIGDASVTRNSSRFRQIATLENGQPQTGIIDHVCFQLDLADYEVMNNKLTANEIVYDKYEHQDKPLKQIWVLDPNNVRVELNFCN